MYKFWNIARHYTFGTISGSKQQRAVGPKYNQIIEELKVNEEVLNHTIIV